MKNVNVVACKKCGASFRNRRFWVLPKNDPKPRKRCPRCFATGPFEEATEKDIEAFSKKISTNFLIFGIFELLISQVTIIAVTYGFLK